MKNYWIMGAIGVVVLVVSIMLLTNKQSTPETTPTPKSTEANTPIISDTMMETQPASDSAIMGETKEFTVTSTGFKFNPAEIKVKTGDKVKITYKNTGGTHNLTILDFNVATKQLKSGEEETIEFVAGRAGTFEFYCAVGKHRAMGMTGKLIVE